MGSSGPRRARAPRSTPARRCSRSSVSAASISSWACSSCCWWGASCHTVRPGGRRRMVELWFGIVAAMLTAYVVLDGFDLGAGALHLWVARTDAERRLVLAAIGPYWDASEVWLLATGGALLVAFPGVFSSGVSG